MSLHDFGMHVLESALYVAMPETLPLFYFIFPPTHFVSFRPTVFGNVMVE